MAPPVEISIPTTSVASPDDSKPYTQYNITLRLPLRSFVVQKRYSDFTALHDTLTQVVGAPPPEPIPGKHWFKSTVSSPELTEDRRRGLETYLRAVAESPDRRWRDTAAWRQFLSLPATSGGGSAASASGVRTGAVDEGKVPAINLHGANAAAAEDPTTWTDLHREMKGQLHEARLQLARRDAASDSGGFGSGAAMRQGSTAAVEAGASAKRALVRAGSLLTALDGGLRAMSEMKRLGEGELRRRRDLLSAARLERDGLEKLCASLSSTRGASGGASPREGAPNAGDKATLLSGAGGSSSRARTGGRVLGAPLPETDRTRELGNSGVLQLQRTQMQEQDEDVEELSKIIRRQREMGLAIKNEVDVQNEMLDQMDRDADRLGGKMQVANKKARKLGK